MILYVLRHGRAEDRIGQPDAVRRLTRAGTRKMREEAAGMRTLGLRFDAILTSPLPRAAETAQIVAAAFRGRPAPRESDLLAPGAAPSGTLAALAPLLRSDEVMIVGHEPMLSGIASLLLTGSSHANLQLKKGGLIALEFDQAIPGRATLLWMLTPRQLCAIGK